MSRALVILCGGLSRRMGCDKSFLPFGDTSLLNYQVRRFRPYFEHIYVSVPSFEDRSIDYMDRCGCEAIHDEYSKIGPIGGLYSCLNKIEEDMAFFMPVDAPFTDAALAAEICDTLESNPSADICCIVNEDGRMQPLFTAYRKTCLEPISLQIRLESYKLQVLLRNQNTIVLEKETHESQFFNMNTPEDYYFALGQLLQDRNLSNCMPSKFNKIPEQDVSIQSKAKKPNHLIPRISFAAISGTGKTTYLEKLLPLLKAQGLTLAMIKHDAHGFQVDKPGKDSYRLTKAGADHMILTSTDQTAAIITHKGQAQELQYLQSLVGDVDLIITEGYKMGTQAKVQILRKGHCETPAGNKVNTIAYVSDFPYETDEPVFDLNEPEQIVPFLMDFIKNYKPE